MTKFLATLIALWAVGLHGVELDMNEKFKSCSIHLGKVVHFIDDPFYRDVGDTTTYDLFLEGALVVDDAKGIILQVGEAQNLTASFGENCSIVDHGKDRIIFPGMIDAHSHYAQDDMIAAYGDTLYEWLETYTFPYEERYKDKAWADRGAEHFIKEMINVGTTTFATFATLYQNSVDSLFEAATKRNMRVITGQVGMDRTESSGGWAPDDYYENYTAWARETRESIKKWHENGRNMYAITPRFAPSSTADALKAAKAIWDECPSCFVQTHVSENLDEVDFVIDDEFPNKFNSYVQAYNEFGLVGPRTLLGHAIHMSEYDYLVLNTTGAVGVHCPTSNLFLGSGLYNIEQYIEHDVPYAIGTDVGAGTSNSMLNTLNEAYKVAMLQVGWLNKLPANDSWNTTMVGVPESHVKPNNMTIDARRGFYWVTQGNAKALHLDDKIGNFDIGKEADFVVFNPSFNSISSYRMEIIDDVTNQTETDDSFWERMFVLMTLGDDRTVEKTYIMGKQWK